MAEAKQGGVSERQYKLLDICEKEFVSDTGELIPYYEIWVKSLLEQRVMKFKPLDNKGFKEKLVDYKPLIGAKVSLTIDFKDSKKGVIPVVSSINPVL